jgi:hypothetical protein
MRNIATLHKGDSHRWRLLLHILFRVCTTPASSEADDNHANY